MDEDTGVRAPVTRRRGKVSVEQSDGKPSPAPGTPTKKRGGRKPAKPELELINENVVEDNLKATTKKTAVKEIKDNIEEKPVTPSRRSARIKSNTSIVSDTVQSFDSPRAKRATRRNSQIGSDTEIPLTPIRQTRRTRRDSTSSIEKQDAVTADVKTTTNIPEVISEEPENTNKVTSNELKSSDNENSKQSPIRKSPRLLNKKPVSSNSSINDDKNSELDSINIAKTSQSEKQKAENLKVSSKFDSETTNDSKNSSNISIEKTSERVRLSMSSANLIKELDINPPKHLSHVNKSLSEVHETNKSKPKRHRTKSWTTITAPSSTNDDFYSDNEKTRKKRQSKCYVALENVNISGSGDCKLNSSKCDDKHNEYGDISEKSNSIHKSSVINREISMHHASNKSGCKNEETELDGGITNLFKSDPSNNIQAVVLMEDSDNCKQIKTRKEDVNEDQCVPVVDHDLRNEKSNDSPDYTLSTPFDNKKDESIFKQTKSIELKTNANDSCEPMDVDETLPEILTNNVSNKEFVLKEKSFSRESTTNISLSKSPRKSSICLTTCENLDKSGNENKSTLILSQLKDSVSENKSPKISNSKLLSKSVNTPNIAEPTSEINKTLSQNYLTSTPLQKKNIEKQGEPISKMFDNDVSKSKGKITPKKNLSAITNSQSSEIDSSADDESITSDKESLLDNEAEEASDSYLSGNSRDEEEKQYEKDNEIVEKGETLTSEDELSSDSDYEKDSFLVSSDEEDNELLSGSGDDLSMSDNELNMTSKSKKKYNEKKLKQQKQVSREMFQSRHKLNNSNKSSELKQKNSLSSDSSQSEDDVIRSKNNKRNRLISVNESATKSDLENSTYTGNKKARKSQESSYKHALTENEITICDETSNEIQDPLLPIPTKIGPKTLQKDTDIAVGFVDTNNVKDTRCQPNTSNSRSKNPLEDTDDDSSSLSSEDINIAKNYDNVLKELKSKPTNGSLKMDENSTANIKQNKSDIETLNSTKTKESTKLKNKSSENMNNVSLNLNESNDKSGNNGNINFKENTKTDIASNTETIEKSNLGNFSLTLSKKLKKKDKPLIVDQLNLTQVKDAKTTATLKSKTKKMGSSNGDDSSDSIDLKLLFSEDSINSADSNKNNERKAGNKFEEFIPLKKSEGRTNIRANEDIENKEEEEVPYFVDTIGDRSIGEDNIDRGQKSDSSSADDSKDEPPVEISYKKRSSLVNSNSIKGDQIDNKNKANTSESPQLEKASKKLNASNVSESATKKKKKQLELLNKSNLTETQPTECEEVFNQSSVLKTPKSDKQKKNSLSESLNKSNLTHTQPIESEDTINQLLLLKTPKIEKKKNKILSESLHEAEDTVNHLLTSKTPKSDKKKKSNLSESLHMSILTTELIDADETNNKSETLQTPKSAKKNKNHMSQSLNKSHLKGPESIETAEVINISISSQTPKSAKKNKTKLLESLNNSMLTPTEIEEAEDINIQSETTIIASCEKKERKQSKSPYRSMLEDNNMHEELLDRSANKDKKIPKTKNLLSQLETDDEAQTRAKENESKKDRMITNEGEKVTEGGKKRKRKHSGTPALEVSLEGEATNESVLRQSKKLRVSQNHEETAKSVTEEEPGTSKVAQNTAISAKKKSKESEESHINETTNTTKVPESQNKNENLLPEIHFTGRNENKENGHESMQDVRRENQVSAVSVYAKASKSKKRKNREDDDGRHKDAKVLKENSLDQIHIPRLPPSVLNELVDKPKIKAHVKKQKAISTTEFEVLENTKGKNKPSNYLEESIYIKDIGDDYEARKKQKAVIKKPQVLPFVPTATISNSGFTTNFKVNIIPKEIKFVAQSNNVTNFKNDYLYRLKINRRSQSHTRKNRNIKMAKF